MDSLKFFKIHVLGDQETGKTQILSRLANNKFTEAYKATIGCDFVAKKTSDGYTIQGWDHAGQKRFAALENNFFKGGDAFVLVASYDRESSLPELKTFAKKVKDVCPHNNAKVLVLINKADLEPSKRKFSEADVVSVMKTELLGFCHLIENEPLSVSAKSDAEADGTNFTGISEVFDNLTKKLFALRSAAVAVTETSDIDDKIEKLHQAANSVFKEANLDLREAKRGANEKKSSTEKASKRNFYGFKI